MATDIVVIATFMFMVDLYVSTPQFGDPEFDILKTAWQSHVDPFLIMPDMRKPFGDVRGSKTTF